MAKPKKQSEAVALQKLANSSAVQVQKMVNAANQATLNFNKAEAEAARKYNTAEAEKARKFNQVEAATARQFNSQEAQKARDWEQMMSNTSHQREVADLKAAGLNPVLSVNNGANSYSTSSASASAASANNASSGNASASLESGAGAIGSLMSGLIGSMAGLQQTQMSTAAQLKSAQLSASAQRYAAAQSAAATKYAADRSYQAQMDKPQDSIGGLIDKYFGPQLEKSKKTPEQLYKGVKNRINNFSVENLKGLKVGSFNLSKSRGNIDDCRSVLRTFGVELNNLKGNDRKRAARALYDLQYSKTSVGAVNTLANLKKKSKK